MTDFQPGDTIEEIFGETGTGLVQSDFDIALFKNGQTSATAITVAETSTPGFYSVRFTTDSTDGAVWSLDISNPADPLVTFQGSWRVLIAEPANTVQQNSQDNRVPANLSDLKISVDNIKERLRLE